MTTNTVAKINKQLRLFVPCVIDGDGVSADHESCEPTSEIVEAALEGDSGHALREHGATEVYEVRETTDAPDEATRDYLMSQGDWKDGDVWFKNVRIVHIKVVITSDEAESCGIDSIIANESNARDKMQQEHAAEVAELRRQLAEKTAECEKLSLHAAGFPDKPDWVGQHLQSWIKNKDALVAAANKMAGEELDRRFKTDDVVTDLRQRLERAVELLARSQVHLPSHKGVSYKIRPEVEAFLAAESQRTTDGEAGK